MSMDEVGSEAREMVLPNFDELFPGKRKGSCTVQATFTLNLPNYEALKTTVGFTEEYSGLGEDTYEKKYSQLSELAEEKLNDLTIKLTKNVINLSKELHKYVNKKHKQEEP